MKKILIIDDDLAIQAVFKRFLVGHGYDVVVASNGREGLQRFGECHFDLVVTDIMMPEADGLEILMEFKKMQRKPPVIAISGGMRTASMDFLPVARKLGAREVLYKPVELEQLLALVQETLDGE